MLQWLSMLTMPAVDRRAEWWFSAGVSLFHAVHYQLTASNLIMNFACYYWCNNEINSTETVTDNQARKSTTGTWGSVVVSLGIFSEATDGTMCPGVQSASKNEYQENSWWWRRPMRKGDDLTAFIVPNVDPGALNSWNPKSHIRLVAENLYLLPIE